MASLCEAPGLEVGVFGKRHLELAAALGRFHVDARRRSQLREVLVAVFGPQDMKGALATIQAVAK